MLRVLRLYLKVAIFQPELREHAPHITSVLSRSCRSTLRVLRLYLQAAIFKPELPRTRGESNPRPRDCESRRANHETTSKGRFVSQNIARRHSESASTRTISAEGSPRLRQFARRHSESASTRTISAESSSGNVKKNAKTTRVFAPRPRRSPQWVHPGTAKNATKLEFLHLDHADLRRGSRGHIKKRKTLSFCTLDHADPRRGFIRAPQKSKICTSTTPIPADCRVRTDKNAKTTFESPAWRYLRRVTSMESPA